MGGGRAEESKAEEGPRGGQGRRGQAGGDMLAPPSSFDVCMSDLFSSFRVLLRYQLLKGNSSLSIKVAG